MSICIENARAKAEYSFQEILEAGVSLTGGEVKMIRGHHGSLVGAHVRVVGSEAMLLNAQISKYPYSREEEYDPKRSRRLLLHKREILRLQQALETKGLSVIPVAFFISNRKIKLKLAIAKGKKQYGRREEIKKRDLERETMRDQKLRMR